MATGAPRPCLFSPTPGAKCATVPQVSSPVTPQHFDRHTPIFILEKTFVLPKRDLTPNPTTATQIVGLLPAVRS